MITTREALVTWGYSLQPEKSCLIACSYLAGVATVKLRWQLPNNDTSHRIQKVIVMTSQWVRRRLKSPASRLFTQLIIQIKENIKAPRHWPLCGEFTGDWWIPRTKGQWRGKCFHLMTSSWSFMHSRNVYDDTYEQSFPNLDPKYAIHMEQIFTYPPDINHTCGLDVQLSSR